MNTSFPARKSPRLREWDYSTTGAYFVTICTKDRLSLLSEIETDGRSVSVKLKKPGMLTERFLQSMPGIDNYVIMPNHIHFIVFIDQPDETRKLSLTGLVRSLKTLVSKETGCSIWQRSFFDHYIRNDRDYLRHWKYIEENPIKWVYDPYY